VGSRIQAPIWLYDGGRAAAIDLWMPKCCCHQKQVAVTSVTEGEPYRSDQLWMRLMEEFCTDEEEEASKEAHARRGRVAVVSSAAESHGCGVTRCGVISKRNIANVQWAVHYCPLSLNPLANPGTVPAPELRGANGAKPRAGS